MRVAPEPQIGQEIQITVDEYEYACSPERRKKMFIVILVIGSIGFVIFTVFGILNSIKYYKSVGI